MTETNNGVVVTTLTLEQKQELLVALQERTLAITRVNLLLMDYLPEDERRRLMTIFDDRCVPTHVLRNTYLDGAFSRGELKS